MESPVFCVTLRWMPPWGPWSRNGKGGLWHQGACLRGRLASSGSEEQNGGMTYAHAYSLWGPSSWWRSQHDLPSRPLHREANTRVPLDPTESAWTEPMVCKHILTCVQIEVFLVLMWHSVLAAYAWQERPHRQRRSRISGCTLHPSEEEDWLSWSLTTASGPTDLA